MNAVLLTQAIEALKKNLPVVARVDMADDRNVLATDAVINFRINNKNFEYLAEIKRTANKEIKNQILIYKRRVQNVLLVTRYVNPRLAEDFVRDGVEFIDTAGNVFLHHPDLFIYIKGNKAPALPRDMEATKPFPPQALKVIFALLCKEKLLNMNYREIAQQTDAALGTVALVMKQLEILGFLINKKGHLALIQKNRLLRRWVEEYNARLRPKLFIGRYRGEPEWWDRAELPLHEAWWGGEIAAAKLTRYIKPELLTIYVRRQNLDHLILQNRLKKDLNGNVEILEKFWEEVEAVRGDIVHPILIYADLLGTGDLRNVETAEMIYERELAGFIGKD